MSSRIANWSPGLDDTATLRAAYDTMPGGDASCIPSYVKILENPASPIALPGAVDLFAHDCIHIVLGRGMLPQDEAFVIGVTMGASGCLAGWHAFLFKIVSRFVYRGAYRFSRTDLSVFSAGIGFAASTRIAPLHDVPWRDLLDRPLGVLRASLRISNESLLEMFEWERETLPDSSASQRLPRAATYI